MGSRAGRGGGGEHGGVVFLALGHRLGEGRVSSMEGVSEAGRVLPSGWGGAQQRAEGRALGVAYTLGSAPGVLL